MGLLFCSSFVHPFYVSIIQVDHSTKANGYQLTFKMFTDDLEAALKEQGTDKINLGTAEEHPKTDQYLFKYIQNGFTLNADGTPQEMQWVGKEVDYDITWCYLEIPNRAAPKAVTVDIDLLTELHEEQANIVHVKVGGKEQSQAFNKNFQKTTFSY